MQQQQQPVRKSIDRSSIAHFISMIHRAKLGPPPLSEVEAVPPPIVTIGKKRTRPEDEYVVSELDSYKITDKETWRKWRDEQIVPSASMIASYFGLGYKSITQELREIAKLDASPEPNAIVSRMMNHGDEFEDAAKRAYVEQSASKKMQYITNGENSYIFEIERNDKRCKVLVTPDIVVNIDKDPLLDEDATDKRVVEIKCPAYGTTFKSRPIPEVVEDHIRRWPFGKPGHFLQAATYAFVFECNRFDVFYYFTNTINTAWVRIRYKMTEQLKDMLFGALVFCNERLDIIVNRQTCPYPIPRATERKKNAIKVMEECFLFTTQLVECEPSLDEEPSNQGENNGP